MEAYFDEEAPQSKNYLVKHWRGELSLPVSYWVNATLIAGLVPIPLLYLTSVTEESGVSIQLTSAILMFVLVLSILISVWAIVGTWRSSDNHSYRGGSEGWATAAKFFMFVGALRLLVQLANLGPFVLETSQLAVGVDSMGAPAKVAVQGQDLTIVGPLALGTSDLVEQALLDNPNVRRVLINSQGGRLGEAAAISKQVTARQMNTVAQGECSSACTMILVAGVDRSLAAGTKVGFHGPSYPGLGAVEINPALTLMAESYRAAGLEDSFVTNSLAVDPSTLWYPKESELFEVGVVNLFDSERIAQSHKFEVAQYGGKLPLRIDAQTFLQSAVADGIKITYNYTVNLGSARVSSSEASKILKGKIKPDICSKPLIPELVASGARYVFNYDYSTGGQLTRFTIDDCSK
jgi:hypothetical protein